MRAVCCEANDRQIFCVFSFSLSLFLSLARSPRRRRKKNEEKEKEKEKREKDELVRRAKNGANRFFLQTERPIIEQQVVWEKTSGTTTAYTHINNSPVVTSAMQKESVLNSDISLPQPPLPPTLVHHPNYPMLLAAQQQLYDYAVRLRFGGGPPPPPSGAVQLPGPPSHHPSFNDPHSLYAFHQRHDPRLRCLLREEPKPSYSYIGLIAMAILSSPERKLVLSDIYQWILDHYAYFRARGPGWRNSIRHNLSLNDCFIKAGRSANGKGHYWSIHPANLADFSSGDFRRRRAQRRVRKSMGLSVPDDEEDEDEILPTNGIFQIIISKSK